MRPVGAGGALLEAARVRVGVVVHARAQRTVLALLEAQTTRVAQVVVPAQQLQPPSVH